MNRSNNLMQAAVVLNSLPKQQAANLLSRLEPGDIKTVLDAIKLLDGVSASQISEALNRFAAETERWRVGNGYASDAAVENAQRTLDVALATPPSQLETDAESTSPFEFLVDVLPMLRMHVLQDEHPKNIAIVLSMLSPSVASEVMQSLDDILRVSVLKRLCELDEVHEEEVAELSFAIKLRLKKLLNSQQSNSAGVNIAADMLSCTDNGMRETLLAVMGQTDPDLADKLNRSVFKIDRLETLDDAEVKTVLKHVDTASWAPALKNAPATLQTKVFANMARTAAEMLNDEMSEIGRVDKHVEHHAQQDIVQTVLKLAREGKLELRNGPRQSPITTVFPQLNHTGPFHIGSDDATSPIN